MMIITKKNRIGIEEEMAAKIIAKLDDLLANYQIFYMNVRGFHWNIRGNKFFELHAKFEELYDDVIIKIDEVAERVLTLGGTPTHAYTDYLSQSEIPEKRNISDGNEAVENILDSFQILLKKERQILQLTDEAGDEGTNSLMSDYITEKEKLSWMYDAFLG